MPDPQFVPENYLPETGQGDLLEQLLVVAAEKAAKQEADDALKKGFVTREQINAALAAFGENLENSIVDKVSASLMPQVTQAITKAIESTPGLRKSTVQTPEDERDEDPVGYLLKKAREQGPESFDDVDKQLAWAITYTGLAQGLTDK